MTSAGEQSRFHQETHPRRNFIRFGINPSQLSQYKFSGVSAKTRGRMRRAEREIFSGSSGSSVAREERDSLCHACVCRNVFTHFHRSRVALLAKRQAELINVIFSPFDRELDRSDDKRDAKN